MRRLNPIRENPDSDQSISEEEETDDVYLEHVVSINPSARNKEELPLPVRLDFLRGARKQSLDGIGSSSSFEKPTGAPLEDEVEFPDFEEVDFNRLSGEVVANSSDEEITSNSEGNTVLPKSNIGSSTKDKELLKLGLRSIRSEQNGDTNEESKALLRGKESASCSTSHDACSKANRCSDGMWSKAKPRFSVQLPSHKHEPPGPLISNCDNSVSFKIPKLLQTMKSVHPGISAYSVGSYVEDDEGMGKHSETEPPEAEGHAHEFNPLSMADLVGNLHDKSYLYLPYHSQRRGKKVKHFSIRSRSHLRDRIVDGDSPEPMDSGSSSDNEAGDQNMKIAFTENKMQTMADRFQEALGASYVTTDEGTHVAALKSSGAGIFGNLQRVMQKEKERDMDFLKRCHSGGGHGCVDVKIISRHLDGKLTVCCCSFCEYTEEILLPDNSKGMVCGGQERTIIFSPRVCDNVDVEVGNMIRIQPPWKEVQVGNDNIILCTYFSEIPCPD